MSRVLTDKHGRPYSKDNPFPIKVTGTGSVGGGNGGGGYSNAPKQHLCVQLSESNQMLVGDIVKFDRKVVGNIPYDPSSGAFTLSKDKVYRISLGIGVMLGNEGIGWTLFYLKDAETNEHPHDEAVFGTLTEGKASRTVVAVNSATFLFKPNATKDYHIEFGSSSYPEESYEIRSVHTMLTIDEV